MDITKLNISNYIVYGDDTDVLSPNFVHFERMEASRRKHQGDIKAHIHSNIFQVLIVESGSLEFTSEAINGDIEGPAVVLIPENTLHAVQLKQNTVGAVLNLSQHLLERLFEQQPQIYMAINQLQHYKLQGEYGFVKSLADRIQEEMITGDDPHDQVMHSLLVLLFTEFYRRIREENGLTGKITVDDGHFARFQRLIRQNGTTEKSLKDYAGEIGITTTHLNRICKATVGKRASEVIKEHIILEAKRHLRYTSHTISEVAHLLEFSSPSYFNRYFTKEVGITPKAYRNEDS